MSPSWTEPLFEYPWLPTLLWVVLYSLDHYLTLWGAALYHRGANRVVQFPGSYELNPLFQSAIDQGRLLSKRFLATLAICAACVYAVFWMSRFDPQLRPATSIFLGTLLFVYPTAIMSHLRAIAYLRTILRTPSPVEGSIRYDRPTIYALTLREWLSATALVALCALLAPSPFLLGGLLGMAVVCLDLHLLGRKAARALAQSAGANAEAAPQPLPVQPGPIGPAVAQAAQNNRAGGEAYAVGS